jgi:hypothetical protein
MNYKQKYLKYKKKYLNLQNQLGGNGGDKRKRDDEEKQIMDTSLISIDLINISRQIYNALLKYINYKNTNETHEDYMYRISKLNIIDDSTAPLQFDNKLKLKNEFLAYQSKEKSDIKKYELEDIIECYSHNDIDMKANKKCNVFQEYDETENDNEQKIPPVKLIEVNGRYNIQDGRHRVTAHIIKNIPNIHAIITNDGLGKRKPSILSE